MMTGCFQALMDEKVRSVLADHADSGGVPRPAWFFFYGGDWAGLGTAATEAGYQVHSTANNDGIVLETLCAVDEQAFSQRSAKMERWADEFGCHYDGWECQVVTQ